MCIALIGTPLIAAQHPNLFITKQEAIAIKQALGTNVLLDRSFNKMKRMVDAALQQPVDVPQPGEAGGYEHERHKQNYREMRAAGVLFTITGDDSYASFIKGMLMQYADMYPTLGPHPLAHHQKPGRLFHQMLNEYDI